MRSSEAQLARLFQFRGLFKLCGLSTLLLVLAAEAAAVPPTQDFWPMNEVSSGVNRPWWHFKWTNGGTYPPDSDIECPAGDVQDTLTYLSLNNHAFDPRSHTVVNMVKEGRCAYWAPTGNQESEAHLRWYTEGWQEALASANSAGETLNFISFRGWTIWERDTSVNNNTATYHSPLSSGMAEDYVIEGATGSYRPNTVARQRHLIGNDPTSRLLAEAQFPTYAVVPDESLRLRLQLTSGQPDLGPIRFQQHDGSAWQDRGNVANLTYRGCPGVTGGPGAIATLSPYCDGEPVSPTHEAVWRLWTRPTDYKYEDKDGIEREVIYTAYVEGIEGIEDQKMVCEEWFFAEGVGPIAIAELPATASIADCFEQLAMSNCGLDDPYAYYNSSATQDRIIGFQWLEDYCLDNCWVGNTNSPPTPEPGGSPAPPDPPCEPCVGPFCPDVECDVETF
ncbi:MAG: hypothetical protein AAF657_17275 [Acidobacteriota bacterium]